MASKSKIKRKLLATFLNTGTGETPVWSLIGDGVTEQTIAYNPQTEEETYIHEDSGSTDVSAYKPTIPTPMTAIKGDEVFEFVDDIRIHRKVLDEAVTECVIVYLYKTAETAGKYTAEKNRCCVQIDDFGGAGGESAKLNFTLNLQGDPVYGLFDPATKTFTEEGYGRMTENIMLDLGGVRLTVNDDPARVIAFNPSDVAFVGRFYGLIERFETMRQEYQGKSLALEKNKQTDAHGLPVTAKQSIQLLEDFCDTLRGMIDEVFGEGTSQAAFGGAKTLTMFAQFFEAVTPYIERARKEKIAKYIAPVAGDGDGLE